MPPRSGFRSFDPYAANRCACGHLVYADQVPGGNCMFCPCDDHQPQAVAQ